MLSFKKISENLKIKARDGMTIHGTFYPNNGKKLVIFVHGLTANYMQGICKRGQEFFLDKGYDCFLINLYSDEIKDHCRPRALYDGVTLKRHITDVQDVFAHFKDKYEDIFLVGHSYGGLTIALSGLPASAMSLWDATFLPNAFRSSALVKEDGALYLDWNDGQYHKVGQAIVQEGLALTEETVGAAAKEIACPVQINLTNFNFKRNSKYGDYIPHHEIKAYETDHNFSEPDARHALCENTFAWFETHLEK